MTKHTLFALLASPQPVLTTIGGVSGYLDSIQREDGGGRSFNVIMTLATGFKKTVHIRTID